MKSECVELNELVSAYADGELAGEDLARVEGHLGGCPDCRAFVATCRKIDTAVADGPEPPEVEPARWEAMRGQLLAAAGPSFDRRRSRFRIAKAAAFLTTMAAACLLGFMAMTHGVITDLDQGLIPTREVSVEFSSDDSTYFVFAAPEDGVDILLVIDVDDDEEAESEPAKDPAGKDGKDDKAKSGEAGAEDGAAGPKDGESR
jgi:hypothetical protein